MSSVIGNCCPWQKTTDAWSMNRNSALHDGALKLFPHKNVIHRQMNRILWLPHIICCDNHPHRLLILVCNAIRCNCYSFSSIYGPFFIALFGQFIRSMLNSVSLLCPPETIYLRIPGSHYSEEWPLHVHWALCLLYQCVRVINTSSGIIGQVAFCLLEVHDIEKQNLPMKDPIMSFSSTRIFVNSAW